MSVSFLAPHCDSWIKPTISIADDTQSQLLRVSPKNTSAFWLDCHLFTMASSYHELDPDGDVELILRNPDAPFAEWDESSHVTDCVQNSLETPTSILTPASKEAARKLNEEDAEKSRPMIMVFESLDRGKDYEAPLKPRLPVPEPAREDTKALSPTGADVEVRMRLSSKHLVLASAFFKKMLQGPWKESRTRTLEASDWDAEALLILMNIIHGRHRAVPRSISLEMLAKISVLVDYYQCHEVVELFAACWTRELSPGLPTEYGRDLTLWLSISWVFSQEPFFNALTKVAIKETTGPFQTLGLPIPQRVVGK